MEAAQKTLTETLNKSATNHIPEDRIESLRYPLNKLTIPTPENSSFSHSLWNQYLQDISGYEALKLREEFGTDTNKYNILSAIAAKKLHNTAYIKDAFPIEKYGDPSHKLYQNVLQITLETIKRYPLTALLSGWVSTMYVAGRDSIKELVGRTTSGFYHPDQHWIAISRDPCDPEAEYWPVARKAMSEHYERSVTIHELGHALQYMFGLQTEGSETVDNRDISLQESTLHLKTDCIQSNWQYKFVYHCVKSYALLLDGTYETLRFNNYQHKNVEEMFAEGFNAYITAPRYLAQIQPLLHTILSTYCERQT